MRSNLSLSATFLLLGCLAGKSTAAVTAVSSITSTGSSTTHDELVTATVGSTTYSAAQIVKVSTAVSENVQADYDINWKASAPKPDDSTLDALTDLSFTTGLLNPGFTGAGYINFTLESAATVGVMIFEPNGASGEAFSLQALNGSGGLIGSSVGFNSNSADFGMVTASVTFDRDSAVDFAQPVYGAFIPIADFGVSSAAGFRLTSSNGDPSLLVGVVPEPSSAILAALGSLALFRRRR